MGLDASQLLPGQQPFPDTKPEYTGPVPLAPTYPAAPLSEVNERLSRPPYLTGYAGVLTIVPRRGWDAKTNLFLSDIASNPVKALSQWSMSQPLRLLYSLADIHPLVGAARSVWLSMSFGQDDTRFIAVDDKGDENEDVSKLLVDLMEHQDVSIGGLVGLQNAIGEQALNPYGRAKFAPALGEALADIARNTNLNDVIKSVAWPRLTVGFPYQEILQYAEEHPEVLIARAPDGGDLTPAQYAMAEFQRVGEKMLTLKADDVFIYPVGG
ncbi:MAG: hypothetical protein EBR82_73065, partial [Caulobacteraceae bacterium]|nr:hypothetical protein [Caulobacteraceae bacterium]